MENPRWVSKIAELLGDAVSQTSTFGRTGDPLFLIKSGSALSCLRKLKDTLEDGYTAFQDLLCFQSSQELALTVVLTRSGRKDRIFVRSLYPVSTDPHKTVKAVRVSELYPSAAEVERELSEKFGILFDPENIPEAELGGYPLRKEFIFDRRDLRFSENRNETESS